MKKEMKLKSSFKIAILINALCASTLIWQAIQCITKYTENPKGVSVSMKLSKNEPFPIISVCPKYDDWIFMEGRGMGYSGFNKTFLTDICNISYEDYFKNGKWANRTSEECSDPKEVLENAVFKQENIVEAWISYFDDEASGANITWNSIESVRTDAVGRCFTMNTDELKAHGIAVISLHIKSPKSYVSVHTKGLLLNANGEELSLSRYIPMGYDVHLSYKYEVFNMLDYGGEACNMDDNYNKDLCINQAIEEQSLEKIGCTTPFGSTKTQICQNVDEGKNASQIYNEGMNSKVRMYGGCSNPCSFLSIKKSKESFYQNGATSSRVWLRFEEIVKVTEGYHVYSGLSLFAEIGGYVGLLLGVSLNQVTKIVDSLVVYLQKLMMNRIQVHD